MKGSHLTKEECSMKEKNVMKNLTALVFITVSWYLSSMLWLSMYNAFLYRYSGLISIPLLFVLWVCSGYLGYKFGSYAYPFLMNVWSRLNGGRATRGRF